MSRSAIHAEKGAVGFHYRSALDLMTMSNGKTPKGESLGYLSAILYLMPHTSGGGGTLCPYSTEACRAMCLAGSGLSALPKAMGAKQRRTDAFRNEPETFAQRLMADVSKLRDIARREGMKPVVRLNGTSDVIWEREAPIIMAMAGDVQFMDYTKIPMEHRRPPRNYHLTFSIEGPGDMIRAVGYLRAGHVVAAVVDVPQKDELLAYGKLGDWTFIDGDEHDLRFLNPPGSIVLLRPKGHVRTSLMRPNLLEDIWNAREKQG